MITAPTRRRQALLLALAVLGTASLAACTAGPGSDGNRPRSSAVPADPAARPDLGRFYGQKLTWRPCGAYRCAALTVPMDYSRPGDGRTFVLPVAKAVTAAPGKRVGSLVLNPGGPGERGVRLIKDGVADDLGRGVRERFDVVSFDPRGVGESKPALTCRTEEPTERAEPTGGEPRAHRSILERTPNAPTCSPTRGRRPPTAGRPVVRCCRTSAQTTRPGTWTCCGRRSASGG